MQVDVAGAGFIDLEVAAAGGALHRARDFAGADVAGSGLQPDLASKARQFHVARAGLHLDIAARAFDDLVTRTAAAADGRFSGHGDFVVDGNVVRVDIVDVNAVAFLPDRRVLFDLVDVRLASAHQPVAPDENLGANDHR